MNTKKFLIGGIIGGVANFLLGWVVWRMLLMDFWKEHLSQAGSGVFRDEEHMIWWGIISGSLLYGFLLSYILNKSNVKSAGAGATMGAVIGLILAAAINCFIYAQWDLTDITWMAVDTAANTVVTAIIGGIIGWYLGMGKKAA